MKTKALKLLFAAAAMIITVAANAQPNLGPEWGETDEIRHENVLTWQYASDYYAQDDYDQSMAAIHKLIAAAPRAYERIYTTAINIYNKKAKAADEAHVKMYADSMMYFYDKRVEMFGENRKDPQYGTAYILRWKADDYAAIMPMDLETSLKFYADAVKAGGVDTPADFVVRYFALAAAKHQNDQDIDAFMDVYTNLEPIIKASDDEDQIKVFENIFLREVAADCNKVKEIYSKRLAENPNDGDLYEKALRTLNRANCRDDFYMEVAEKAYALNPTASKAITIADIYQERGDNQKALTYLKETLEHQTEADQKALLLVRIAATELGMNNIRGAAEHARQASSLDPSLGLAYEILAQAYANSRGSCPDDFAKDAVYLLVYDTLAKAKSLYDESGDSVRAKSVANAMAQYRGSFPTKENGFFLGITNEGATFKFSNCGILTGLTTTVRFR